MVIVQVPPRLAFLIIGPIFLFHIIQTMPSSMPSHFATSNVDFESPSSEAPAPSTSSSPDPIRDSYASSNSIAPGDVVEILPDQQNRDGFDILKLCHFNTSEDVKREMMRYKNHTINFHPSAALNQGAERNDRNVRKCLEQRDKSIEEFCGTPDCEWVLYWTTIANTCTKYNEDQCLTKERIQLLCCPEQKE
ncbi:hypothetical protein B9Z55_003218 [Caenorhabditis nigoni]|uniref:Uncharacterized protein n=1 Tax=Caenorhabditis nigoni TaxID=1611254 RepID=A0A2G5VP32_9PELO|nr:hypothetical protein B9Z55_003218 [Caenorhabditis nigoni]